MFIIVYKQMVAMKTICVLSLLCGVLGLTPVSAQKLTFSYDAAGNQTERRWACINCRTESDLSSAKKLSWNSEEKNEETEGDMPQFIKVSPNPLTEKLRVIWNTPGKAKLERIEVYSMNGSKVFSSVYTPDQKETEISFLKLPPGVYMLVGYYSDSKKETIKLIKI